MKYLFVHQNFPAQYLHLLRHLAAQNTHDLLFLTEAPRNQLAGVRKIVRPQPRNPGQNTLPNAREIELALSRAELVVRSCENLKTLGFTPDVIIGHHGWGELLHINDVWPDAPLLGYQEFYYNLHGFDVGFDPEFPPGPEMPGRIRTKNVVNMISLNNPGFGQTPTDFQHSTYPNWARDKIAVLREGVNLEVCKPNPDVRRRTVTLGGYKVAPAEKLVTYVVRDLEPYRGFHVFMRALPRILAARPDARVILVGGDGVSYGAKPAAGTWREQMQDELAGHLDLARVHFAGRVPYDTYVKLLQRSDAHVYLTYPFVASWSLREAMAVGCALVVSDTAPVREFVTDGVSGRLATFLQPDTIAHRVLEVLEDQALAARIRAGARAWAEANLDMDVYIRNYEALIARAVGT